MPNGAYLGAISREKRGDSVWHPAEGGVVVVDRRLLWQAARQAVLGGAPPCRADTRDPVSRRGVIPPVADAAAEKQRFAQVRRVGSLVAWTAPHRRSSETGGRLVARFGALVEPSWERLPGVLAELAERWELAVGDAIGRGNTSLVVRCRLVDGPSAVLKLTPEAESGCRSRRRCGGGNPQGGCRSCGATTRRRARCS